MQICLWNTAGSQLALSDCEHLTVGRKGTGGVSMLRWVERILAAFGLLVIASILLLVVT